MVRRVALAHLIGVRIPVSQPFLCHLISNHFDFHPIFGVNTQRVPGHQAEPV